MGFYSQKLYQKLAAALNESIKKKANFLIVTLPGLGITYFVKKYLEKNKEVNYLNEADGDLAEYNILDLDFDKNEKALSIANEYFKKAKLGQKFALIINTPRLVETDEYQKSFAASHLYSTFYFQARERADANIFAREISPELKQKEIDLIYKYSGGIGRIIKYLSLAPQTLAKTPKETASSPDFKRVINHTITILAQSSPPVLNKLGIIDKKGECISLLLAKYLQLYPLPAVIRIKINPDLSFEENEQGGTCKLTKTEAEVICHLLTSPAITREQVADFKWGKDGYDKFSDWAINQTISRLNNKLKHYQLKSIPKVGYQIVGK